MNIAIANLLPEIILKSDIKTHLIDQQLIKRKSIDLSFEFYKPLHEILKTLDKSKLTYADILNYIPLLFNKEISPTGLNVL